MKFQIPQQPIIPGEEEGDGERQELPSLDKHVLRGISFAVQDSGGRVALRERRTVRSRGRWLRVRIFTAAICRGTLRIAGEERLRGAEEELLQWYAGILLLSLYIIYSTNS